MKVKRFLSVLLATSFSVLSTMSVSAAELPPPDLTEGSIGQTYVGNDGTRVEYFNNEVVKARKRTIYNGCVFEHTSGWNPFPNGNQAYAETTSYTNDDEMEDHYHYTRVRVVSLPYLGATNIIEDSGRVWGTGYTRATSGIESEYYEVGIGLRSYWGDETT